MLQSQRKMSWGFVLVQMNYVKQLALGDGIWGAEDQLYANIQC
jgi:hypothetical protein